jgi:basic membrane protein A and related proteins
VPKQMISRRTFAARAAALAATVPALSLVTRVVPEAAAQDPLVATMVTDTAGLGDQNFNDLAYAGGMQAATDFGAEFRVIESTDATSYVPNLIAASEQGGLSIGVGFLLTDAMNEVAAQFPDDAFLLIDSVSDQPNVESVTFKEEQGAFLAGVAAGLFTKSNVVGVVGGQKIPPVVRYAVGFEAGVKSSNPNCEVQVGYADTFDDPGLGKEMTLAQFNNGADISLPAAGRTGIGGYEAVKEKGAGFWVIGADTDQNHLAPGLQLGYVRKGVDTTVYKTIGEVQNGQFQPGAHNLGLEADNGIGFEDPYGVLPPEILAVVDQYRAAVIAGTIVVPQDEDQLAAFTPVPAESLPAVASPESSPSA